MENKIVKKITQAVIFCLCCVLMVGAVSIPTYAYIDNSGYSVDGFTVSVTGSIPTTAVFSDWILKYSMSPALTGIMHWYVSDESQAPLYYTFEVPEVNNGEKFILEFVVPEGYRFDGIFVNRKHQDETVTDAVTITEINGIPTFDITINIGYDIEIVLMRVDTPTLPDKTFQGIITIEHELEPDPDYALGYQEGYNQGFNDGYIEGTKDGNTSFLELLFSPLQALHSVVLFDVNGTQGGGEVTIGGIFGTIVSIMVVVAFLRYFAGG